MSAQTTTATAGASKGTGGRRAPKRPRTQRVIPGFGLSIGVTMACLSVVVLIPLVFLVLNTLQLTPAEFFSTVTSSRVLASYRVSLICALVATLINAAMGTLLAWVLVRYDFPFKRVVDGLVELPFALPTAVAGIALTALCSSTGWVGGIFANFGIDIAYTPIGITVALTFVGFPFVVRAVQPVLEKIDVQSEEAAEMLGASRPYAFAHVILPEIRGALVAGAALCFARCLGEYGSVIFIAGNTPFQTEITPLLIMSQLQEYDYASATAIALVLLLFSFAVLLIGSIVQTRSAKRTSYNAGSGRQRSAVKRVETSGERSTRIGLTVAGVVYVAVLLVLPLVFVLVQAFSTGIDGFAECVTDPYALKAVNLTLLAMVLAVAFNTVFGIFAAWSTTKFEFPGRKIIMTLIDLPLSVSPVVVGLIYLLTYGLTSPLYGILQDMDLQIVFAVPGIVLVTIFVTFPFVSREIIPVMQATGTQEEEAAALMGAKLPTIFSKITFPHIKWALLYGVVLCAARALGEFGAVSVVSGNLRGITVTVPLYIQNLYNEYLYAPAFIMSAVLIVIAVAILFIRSYVEYRGNKAAEYDEGR